MIGHNETLETVMNDLAQAEKRVKRTGVPHFIMGHSMGGGIVLRYAVSRKTEANGIIVSGPLIALGSGSQVRVNNGEWKMDFFKPSVYSIGSLHSAISSPWSRVTPSHLYHKQ